MFLRFQLFHDVSSSTGFLVLDFGVSKCLQRGVGDVSVSIENFQQILQIQTGYCTGTTAQRK